MPISIRVRAKTQLDSHRVVTVDLDGRVAHCDCSGFDGVICAHIDAVLIAGERAMVHPDDAANASTAFDALSGAIQLPAEWKGSWRRDMRWRGLTSTERARSSKIDRGGRPVVCFTGKLPLSREELCTDAEARGWATIDSASPSTDVLVAADPLGGSGKLAKARRLGTPILSYEEWQGLSVDGEF
jgi:hypothetical protein